MDDALVAPVDHVEFRKCNMRLKTDIKLKKATFQVVLDALALTPFYQAFMIIADVPAIYIEIIQICPKIPGQEFEDLPLEQDNLSFIKDLGHTDDITYLTDVNVEYLHQPWRAFATVINKCLSGKETGMDKICLSRAQTLWGTRIKSKAKVAKSNKKKQPAKKPKAKGLAVLSEVALTEAEQLKLATKRSKKDFHISHASDSGDGVDTQSKVPDEQQQKISSTNKRTSTIPRVPDVPTYKYKSKKESWGDSDEEDDDEDDFDDDSDDNDESDDERAESDRDEIPDPNKTNKEHNKEEKEYDGEFNIEEDEKIDDEESMNDDEDDEVTKELYDDVNVNLGNKDTEMTNADQDVATLVIEKNVTESVEAAVLTRSSSQPTSTYETAASLSEFELTKILIDKMDKNKSYDKDDYKKKLYDASVESYNTDKDLFDSYGEVFSLKRSRDKRDKDQDPSAGSDRGTKRRKSSKDAESSRDLRSKEKKSSSTSKDASQSQNKSFDKSAHVEEPSHTAKYVQHAYLGTSHWGLKRQRFYGYASNMTSSKDVYSKRRIIVVTRLRIMKMYDYGHLEEIKVRRDDQKLYTFKEGNFKRLRLQDIEDMLLLLVQQKLTNLTINERYALNVALRMYTKRIVIQRRVKDLQLGVKSYQKKLNLTKPDTFRNRLVRADELHKFSDGTLDDVWSALNDITKGIRMEYLPMRKWSNLDKKRARVMVQDIDKQLYKRRLMRNLEKFVDGRKYGNDLRLLERTI
ncbi:hypothetical protein Tco_0157212 [Tanacetum coccineum]